MSWWAPVTAPAPTAQPQTKQCPYCAETIRLEAVKCRYCGSNVSKPPSGRARRIARSPILAAATLVIGLVSGVTEALVFLGIRAEYIVGRDEPVEEEPFPFGPAEDLDADEVRIIVLVGSVLVGAIGCLAVFVGRRRPLLGSALLLVGGLTGFAVTLVAGRNWILVALSAVLVVAAATTAARVSGRLRRLRDAVPSR